MDTLAQILHQDLDIDGCEVLSVPVTIYGNASEALGPATATHANVAGATSSTSLLAANAARKGAAIFNDSTSVLYVKLGFGASSTSFAVKMEAGAYYEVPFGFTGLITGIWASATGSARVTELA